jgi:hypothetical protein
MKCLFQAFIFLLVLLVGNAKYAAAQCEGRLGTTRVINGNKISVRLPHTMTNADFEQARSPSKWILIDISKGPAPERIFSVVEVKEDRVDLSLDIADLFLTLNRSLEPDREYRLFAPDITFMGGCRPDAVPEGTITFKSPPAAGTRPPSPEKDFFKKSPSKGREDSSVYLSGQLEGANGSSPQVSADIKLETPFDTRTFFQELGPYFNLKASTSKAADANSMNFGLKLRHSFPVKVRLKPGTTELADKQPFLSGVVWDLTPGFESDRRFDNVNVMFGNRFVFVPRTFGNTNRIYLQPFIGFEVGRNIKSPVKEAEDRGIARGTVGGSLYLNLMPKADKALTFQIDYIRRFLLLREIRFTEDDDKKLVPLPVGRGPRDHVKVTLEYGFTDFLGTALSYEYGRLPPNFQLVDHKYGFGLTYKFKTKFPK